MAGTSATCRVTALVLLAFFGALSSEAPTGDGTPEVLVSRQLLESRHLRIGDLVALSADPSGAKARSFRIAGTYEPTPDPARLGEVPLEARLHLPDLIGLGRDPTDPASAEGVGAINVRLARAGDAAAFVRELSLRVPGLIARPLSSRKDAGDPFVVLDRFHLAIAVVTVIASSIFLLALMVMLVDERRETVAILRLIGLRRGRIVTQVFVEGMLIAVAGAGFGVLLALVLEGGFNRFFQWRYDTALVFVRVTAPIAIRSVLLAVPLGIGASLVSSWALLRREVLSLARR